MAVIENLGNMPIPLSNADLAIMRVQLREETISPNDYCGHFTSDGSIDFARRKDRSLWCADLMKFDPQWFYLKKIGNWGTILVCEKATRIVEEILGANDLRIIKKADSGLSVVSDGGYVLPPGIERMFKQGSRNISAEEILEEIKLGETSKLFKDRIFSFERVLDSSLIGEQVKQISFKLFDKEDRVIIHDGRLVERERVYPSVPQNIVDTYYR